MRKKAFKWLSLLLTASMLASGVPAYAAGTGDEAGTEVIAEEEADGAPDTFEEGDYVLTVLDEAAMTAAITGYKATGEGAALTIPGTLGGYTITKIGGKAFLGKQFTGITIPATITEIEYNAFQECNQAKAVLFENGTDGISLGKAVFYGCRNLEKITLSDRITELPEDFASYCTMLEEVVWSKKLKKIGAYAFAGDSGLKSSDLSSLTDLEEIGNYAFKVCTALPVVKFPTGKSLQIGEDAFTGCNMYNGTASGSLTIPANVSRIGQSAFKACSGLGSVNFAGGNDSISLQQGIFSDCERLASITLSDRVEEIPDNFAYNCPNLVSVSWSTKLSSIGAYAFCKDVKLESGDLSSVTALTEIKDYAFDNCNAMPAVKLPTSKSLNIGNYAFSSCSMSGTLTIPQNVKNIGSNAFRGSSGLGEVVFEAGSGSILMETSVFVDCDTLRKITLSNRTTELPNSFASFCDNLESVIWTPELSSIGDSAFANDPKLKSSDLSSVNALRKIESKAFYGCKELPVVLLPTENTLTIGSSAFMYCDMYDGEETGELLIPANVSELGESAFQNSIGLGSVRFQEGDSIIKLGKAVFAGCERLTRIFFSNRVNEIPASFAYGCNKLVWLDGGMKVEKIEEGAFRPLGTAKCEIVLTNNSLAFQSYPWFTDYRVRVDAAVSVVLKDEYTVEAGKSLDLKPQYTVVPENAKRPKLNWDSDNDKVAKVDSNGVVKGLQEGSTWITVTTTEGIEKARVWLIVSAKGSGPDPEPEVFVPVPGGEGATDPQPEITASTAKLTLIKGQKFILGNKDWKSDKKNILKVSKNTVTAKNAGTATLSRSGQEIAVEVLAPAFDEKKLTLVAGEKTQLKVSGVTAGGEKIKLSETSEELRIVFSSSAPDVADVSSDGTVSTWNKGKAVITAWINGVAFKCTVSVVDVQKPSFDFAQTATPLELKPNQTVTVKTRGFSAKKASWSSDRGPTAKDNWAKGVLYEDGVISISKGGKIKAIGVGDSLVTSTDGSVTLNFRVKVSAPAVKSLHLTLGSAKSVKLYGEKGTIEWTPVDDLVTFEKGKINAVKPGSTQLFAKRGGFTYYLNVFVENPTIVGSAAKSPYKMTIENLSAGDTASFKLTSISQDVVFKSNKSSVAYVSPLPDAAGNYTIHARGKGTAKLTAKVNGKSITITVKVK